MSDLMIIIDIFVFSICLTEFLRRIECSCPCAKGIIEKHKYHFHWLRYTSCGDGEGVLTLATKCKACGEIKSRTYGTRHDGMRALIKYFVIEKSKLCNVYDLLVDEKLGHDLNYDDINEIIKKVVKV